MARVEILDKLRFLFEPHPYKVLWGGRSGVKSWSVAMALLVLAMQRPLRILCARELQKSIHESVHYLLELQIDRLGLGSFFDVLQTTIRGTNGSEFIFSGLKSNISQIKSMEGIDIIWVEEAETVCEKSWRVVTPTIRKRGSEIWVTFNPDQETDPTYRRFLVHPPAGAVVVRTGWKDNRWISDRTLKEIEHDYAVDADAADHVWGGETTKRSAAQVLNGKWVVEPFEPQDDWNGPYQGADWGFASDPTTLIRCWITGKPTDLYRELWIEHEAYGHGVENDDIPTLFDSVPDARKYVTRADNARPETISDVRQHGYPRLTAVKKWPGSVEDGIRHLRGYKRIVIHPRCKYTKTEAKLYAYKVDGLTEEVLPIIIDKHNHLIDALRYALDPMIKHRSTEIDTSIRPLEQRNPWRV